MDTGKAESSCLIRLEQQANQDAKECVDRGFRLQVGNRVLQADVVRFYPQNGSEEACVTKVRKIFIFIPGNPGLVDFYLTMLRRLYEKEGGNIWICAIGHAGHSEHCHDNESLTSMPISYQEQIQWKQKFIEHEFGEWIHDEGVEVIVGGHSVGARIQLELIKHFPNVNFVEYLGLCPTVMNIADSPNGKNVTPHLASPIKRWLAFWIVRILAFLLYPVPDFIKNYIVRNVMQRDSPLLDDHFVQYGSRLVNSYIIRNVLHMAHGEMCQIRDVEPFREIISSFKERIVFVLSPQDKWCCNNIVAQMKESFPDATFKILSDSVPHAFCLSHDHIEEIVSYIEFNK